MKRKETGRPARSAPPRARPAGDFADPYQKARRPRPASGGETSTFSRRPRPSGEAGAPPFARERRPPRREPGEAGFAGRERGGREGGFTVTLDSDVARVFRGDASVNKALRLVMQMMQVVQGPPRGFGARGERPGSERRGYQGSAEARGFTRKPRFDEDDEQ
jgi:hypothetical protein